MAGRRPKVRRGYVPAESEAAFAQAVQQLAGFEGWELRYHTYRSDRSAPGFPDEWYVRGPRLVIAELKAENAPPRIKVAERAAALMARPPWLHNLAITQPQAEWLAALRFIGDRVAEVCARDLLCEEDRAYRPSIEVYVWTPADWTEIRQVLAR
jgi:hypothetical protein